jgi:hypothetical protein
MAFEYTSRSRSPDVAIAVRWAGHSRSLTLNRWLAAALLCLLPLLALWYLCSTLYLVFHDPLLASLMARQTDMQYAYEDRIAALKTDLDRETSRALIERQTLETSIRDLGDRGARLEARAATLDSLVSVIGATPTGSRGSALGAHGAASFPDIGAFQAPGPTDPPAAMAEPQPASPDLRLDRSMDSSALRQQDGQDDRAIGSGMARVAASLSRVETRQTGLIGRIREPAIEAVNRMRTALEETGLPRGRWRGREDGGIGGPYVPLPTTAGATPFDQSVDLVRDAVVQYGRLSAIVDRVPLRKPLAGPIEVTSGFGARLDPFFGRPAMHTGIDLHETYGDKVAATADGIVTIAGSEGGYGNMVEIDHGGGLTTRYAHLGSIDVFAHQRVKAGDVVGRVGMTGRTTGPHLHYETRIDGEPVNPARFLKAGAALFPG